MQAVLTEQLFTGCKGFAFGLRMDDTRTVCVEITASQENFSVELNKVVFISVVKADGNGSVPVLNGRSESAAEIIGRG
jgi:hypothetical protein